MGFSGESNKPLQRAVWLTNVDSQVMNSRANLAAGLQRLAGLGFNTIYPAVWQRGYTLYPSEVARELTGASVLPNSPFEGRDLLAEIVELAQPLAMRVMPWFEYGLMVPPQSALARQHPDLLSCDKSGNIRRTTNGKPDPQVWLNPCHDRVRKFIVELITDVVDRYPVAGVQLDDHFAFPVELGYDILTQQLFQHQNSERLSWNEWRSAQLTRLLSQIVSAVRSSRSDCQISIAPNPLSFSKSGYLVDWQQWYKLGLIDELVLQVYRDRLDAFSHELSKPEVRAIQTKIPTLIGILTGLKTRSIATETIAQQVAAIRANRFDGCACFFYETLFARQLSPTLVSRNQQQLIEIFRD